MRPPILDPTAGERARALRLDPDAPTSVLDPTDPRYGEFRETSGDRPGDLGPIVDPTDPNCGAHRVVVS